MLSIIKSMTVIGISGNLVFVQVDVSNGLPYFEIVGLPDTIVREAKERVRIAIKNSGYDFFSKRIVVNLAPANIKKMGALFDLPIAIGILSALEIIKTQDFNDYIIIGELSLDGKIKKVREALAICIELKKQGINNIIIPKENENEVRYIKDINIYTVSNLKEVVEFFNGEKILNKVKSLDYNTFIKDKKYNMDFSEVFGQEHVKRALEIAIAGGHNCLMIGSPGSGKTMLAQRIQTILPDLTLEEALEVTKINSLYGEENQEIIFERPFRNPHYTISESGLIGGGAYPRPGEVTLANSGILFLDELTEYKQNVLEMLRTPVEDKEITISRVKAKVTYPTNFILIAAMNPCPCGYYGSLIKKCTCSERTRKRYVEKISGPLLDRFDLYVEVSSIEYSEFKKENKESTSEKIKERVIKARNIQRDRYKKYEINLNSDLQSSQIKEFCKLDTKSQELLDKFYTKAKISARAYNKIIKVARTIADLELKENIQQKHIAEAIQYRKKEEIL